MPNNVFLVLAGLKDGAGWFTAARSVFPCSRGLKRQSDTSCLKIFVFPLRLLGVEGINAELYSPNECIPCACGVEEESSLI